jgi:proton-dependent oligopeptide transporter, POT family
MVQQRTWFGHPRGLFILFFSEMWERMSFYGMRALLILYMTKYLLADSAKAASVLGFDGLRKIYELAAGGPIDDQPFASSVYGLYLGFVYLTPLFGGLLADRVWGRRRTVYVGGILMMIGHFLLAFQDLFLFGLLFIVLGNGAFKPNISTQVGALYPEGDVRRDGAFTLFYMGINIGAFFSPFVCQNLAVWIVDRMGITTEGAAWHLGFAFAGVGMLIGILVYHFGRHLLPAEEVSGIIEPEKRTKFASLTVLSFFAFFAAFLGLLVLPAFVKLIALVAVIVGTIYAIRSVKGEIDRAKVAAIVLFCLGTVAFWAVFEQQGNTLQIWADDKADWASLGLESSNYQSLNPFFIFAFAPLLDIWWRFRSKAGKTSSSIRKMGFGCFLAGIAFTVLAFAEPFITTDKSLINMAWLAIATWIFTMGELYLSPIGLSLVTKVAPARFLSMMMGLWFVSSFVGGYLSGFIGSFYSSMSNSSFFLLLAIIGGGVGILFLLGEKRLVKLIGSEI